MAGDGDPMAGGGDPMARDGRGRVVAWTGVVLAVASVPLPYLRVGGGPLLLALPGGSLNADAAVAAAVLATAAVSLFDRTRGEQLLGTVAGGLAATVGVGWLAGVGLSAGPGLAVAMAAWGCVEVADLLDPRLVHPRAPRWRAIVAVALAVGGTVGFLLADGTVRILPGVLAVATWVYAVRWELAATR